MVEERKKQLIAHVRKNYEGSWAKPHDLISHLNETASLAAKFASKFSARNFAKVMGLLHDFGKGTTHWQDYLRIKSGYDEFDLNAHLEGKVGKLEHSIIGAKFAEDTFGKGLGRIMSYCIAGHHGGLPDYFQTGDSKGNGLECRLNKASTQDLHNDVVALLNCNSSLKPSIKFDVPLLCALWIRMLFSCLVDADFLDTEKYMEPDKNINRAGFDTIDLLERRCGKFLENLNLGSDSTKVNVIRKRVQKACIVAAESDQGIYTLTVPTGGGKTLSSLAFALKHAKRHGLDRVIYVIPYTSIIEQNAEVFKSVIGEENVVEHHSNLDVEDVTPQMRLASENWDAPVIVTTSVQFYESLFSCKTSRCRKLHNIVNSVIILDEAQLLPVDFLEPILQTLQLLVDYFSATLVIATATQPAFESRKLEGFKFNGLRTGSIKEIIKDVDQLYSELKRVSIELPEDLNKSSTLEEIAEICRQFEQVLCVVSDRKTCRKLFELLPEDTIHLSALMCGQHRSDRIREIKSLLAEGKAVRVVSTQLVEAGVDIDFPVVLRSLAGLDSIAQAAGRCNREGRLDSGKVKLFILDKKAPPGILRKGAETTLGILKTTEGDLLERKNFEKYFQELYWKANSLDSKEIVKKLTPDQRNLGISFRTVSDLFRLIDDSLQQTILVPYGRGQKYLEQLKQNPNKELINRSYLRKMQRYAVNVYVNDFHELKNRGSVEEIIPGVFALTTTIEYSSKIGLLVNENSVNPEELIL